jgi:hypothetical protein
MKYFVHAKNFWQEARKHKKLAIQTPLPSALKVIDTFRTGRRFSIPEKLQRVVTAIERKALRYADTEFSLESGVFAQEAEEVAIMDQGGSCLANDYIRASMIRAGGHQLLEKAALNTKSHARCLIISSLL